MKVAWRKLEGVPVVTVYKGSLDAATDRGCILFFHGLGASKDVQLPDLESLAARGFLVVGVDGVGHGERRYPDFARRLSQANPEFEESFLTVVLKTAEEVPLLIDNLTHAGFIRDGRIGVAGISLGGFITCAAVTLEPRLRTAVAIVGSPEWTLHLPESPHRHLERFDYVRLLSLTAGRDEVVPSHYARRFHRRLESVYSDYSARFAYAEYPDSDHLLEADWHRLWARTLAWFDEQLV